MSFRILIILFLIATSMRASAKDSKTNFLYIIGTYSDDANFRHQEIDFLDFKEGLFGKDNFVLLNANGENTKVVISNPGGSTIRRDANGNPIFYPTQLPALEASLENIADSYKVFGDDKSKENLTLIVGDHGNNGFASLQPGVNLTYHELQSRNQKYLRQKPGALIRSIHLHCHSGSMLVDQKRTLPESLNQLDDFIQVNYSPSSCGLATSHDDELSFYYNIPNPNGNYPRNWKKALQGMSPPTLTKIRDHLEKDQNFPKNPKLTSDYFVEDLAKAVCKEIESTKSLKQTIRDAFKRRCDSPIFDPSLKADSEFIEQALSSCMTTDYQVFYDSVCTNKIAEKHPKDSLGFASQQLIEQAMVVKVNMTKEFLAAYIAKTEHLSLESLGKFMNGEDLSPEESEAATKYFEFVEKIEENEELKVYIENQFPNWLTDNKDFYPELYEFARKRRIPTPEVKTVHEYIVRDDNNNSMAYGERAAKKRTLLRTQLAPLLERPEFQTAKKYLQGIEACENSPLN